MPARTPEELGQQFVQLLNAGDLEGLAALYEPGASLTPAPGTTVVGVAAIRQALGGLLAGKPHITMSTCVVARTDDLALMTGQWQLAISGSDGKPANVNGRSVEVVRRQADGRWLFAIDEPFGLGAFQPMQAKLAAA